jgi:hypothetical protein
MYLASKLDLRILFLMTQKLRFEVQPRLPSSCRTLAKYHDFHALKGAICKHVTLVTYL